jgi:hypothetical protein
MLIVDFSTTCLENLAAMLELEQVAFLNFRLNKYLLQVYS